MSKEEQHSRLASQAASQRIQDAVFRKMTLAFALLVLVLLGAIIGSLMWGAYPAFERFGPGFLTSTDWNPVTNEFGAANAIYGTLVTSAIALLIALPVSLGIAIFLTELCPNGL